MRRWRRSDQRADGASAEGAGPEPAPLARRRWVLAAVLVAAVAIAGLGLASPWWIRSPQQLAAEQEPPVASVLTAPVEHRVVSRTVVLRGTATSPQVFEVTASSGQDGAAPVVTDLRVRQGDQVAAGEVLLEVSGRPLVALPGERPAYRDLRPGAEGEDVAQLQRALQELGYGSGAPDGQFGSATKQAVVAFYEDLGYPAPTTGEADTAAVAAVESEIIQLERRVEDAREARDGATEPEDRERAGRELGRAEEDLARARDRLRELLARTGPMVPASEYVFLPSFPARVHTLEARVGSRVEGLLVGLASGPLVIEAQASAAQAELLRPDLPVALLPEAGEPTTGVITSIAETADPDAPAGLVVSIMPDEPLDAGLAGRGARVMVEAGSSDGEVLAVPVSGLFAAPDGHVYVLRWEPSGVEQPVIVEPGASGDGYVAVTPVDGALAPGDLVVVGSPPVADGR